MSYKIIAVMRVMLFRMWTPKFKLMWIPVWQNSLNTPKCGPGVHCSLGHVPIPKCSAVKLSEVAETGFIRTSEV